MCIINGTPEIPMQRFGKISSDQHASGAIARPALNTWIITTIIFILLIAVFRMELHLRKVEHRSLPAAQKIESPSFGRLD